jgi:Domain of unknown function (DUF1836).
MNENELKKIIEELSSFEQLKFSGIPDIDLYMDQVTTFIDEKLSYLKRNKEDNIMTKTMINNYTKAGILMPPKKKKYSRQHMVLIILTYYLKQVMSIGDIQSLFSPIVKAINSGESHEKKLENIYNKFLEIEKNEVRNFNKDFQQILNIGIEDKKSTIEDSDKDLNELITTVIMLIVKANIQKRMAEKIIDEFFKKEER